MKTHVRINYHQNRVQELVDSRARHFIVSCFEPFVFLSYYFLNLLTCLFMIHTTLN
jgi:hypothetical protein